ncbi:VOC family protein [Rhizorhabdus histidinilytica]
MMTRYDHICLTVGDLDRSIAFYERYFGLKVVRRDAPHKGRWWNP